MGTQEQGGKPAGFKALVVDDEQDIRDFVGFILESQFQAAVEYASSGNQAIARLSDKSNPVDIVVCDYRMPDGTGGDVFKFMVECEHPASYVLCSSDSPNDHGEFKLGKLAGFAEKPMFHEPLTAIVAEFVKTLAKRSEPEAQLSLAPRSFVRIHTRLLRRLSILPCDVYIQINDERHLTMHRKDDIFADVDLEKYQSKGVEHLYVTSTELPELFDKLVKVAISGLAVKSATQAASVDDTAVVKDIEDSICDLGYRLGFTPELQAMVKANLKVTLHLISQNPALNTLLSRISFENGSYIASHSVNLAMVCCWMASKVGWSSEQTFLKLSLAAFLHDVALGDQKLAEVDNEKQLNAPEAAFKPNEVALWREHMLKAAKIAAQFEEVPPDSDVIIAQHHELPHGEGSPHGLTHVRIAPLSALFIVAHSLTDYMLQHGPGFDLEKFKSEHFERYDVGYFKKVMKEL